MVGRTRRLAIKVFLSLFALPGALWSMELDDLAMSALAPGFRQPLVAHVRFDAETKALDVVAQLPEYYRSPEKHNECYYFALSRYAEDVRSVSVEQPLPIACPLPPGRWSRALASAVQLYASVGRTIRYHLPLKYMTAKKNRTGSYLFVNVAYFLPLRPSYPIEAHRDGDLGLPADVHLDQSLVVHTRASAGWELIAGQEVIGETDGLPCSWRTNWGRPSLTIGRFKSVLPFQERGIKGIAYLQTRTELPQRFLQLLAEIEAFYRQRFGSLPKSPLVLVEGGAIDLYGGENVIWARPEFIEEAQRKNYPAHRYLDLSHEWSHRYFGTHRRQGGDLARLEEGLATYNGWRAVAARYGKAMGTFYLERQRSCIVSALEPLYRHRSGKATAIELGPFDKEQREYRLNFFFWTGLAELIGEEVLDDALAAAFRDTCIGEDLTVASVLLSMPPKESMLARAFTMAWFDESGFPALPELSVKEQQGQLVIWNTGRCIARMHFSTQSLDGTWQEQQLLVPPSNNEGIPLPRRWRRLRQGHSPLTMEANYGNNVFPRRRLRVLTTMRGPQTDKKAAIECRLWAIPPGADRAFLAGRDRGAEVYFEHLWAGQYLVTATAPGYTVAWSRLTMSEGAALVELEIRPIQTVTAKVFADGKELLAAPLTRKQDAAFVARPHIPKFNQYFASYHYVLDEQTPFASVVYDKKAPMVHEYFPISAIPKKKGSDRDLTVRLALDERKQFWAFRQLDKIPLGRMWWPGRAGRVTMGHLTSGAGSIEIVTRGAGSTATVTSGANSMGTKEVP